MWLSAEWSSLDMGARTMGCRCPQRLLGLGYVGSQRRRSTPEFRGCLSGSWRGCAATELALWTGWAAALTLSQICRNELLPLSLRWHIGGASCAFVRGPDRVEA